MTKITPEMEQEYREIMDKIRAPIIAAEKREKELWDKEEDERNAGCDLVIYIQARAAGCDFSKWYMIPASASAAATHGKQTPLLDAHFDGPAVVGLASTSCVASGTSIFLTGGVIEDTSNKSTPTNKVFVKDVLSNSCWKEGPPMICPRAGHHSALIDGKIFVFGTRWSGEAILSSHPYDPFWRAELDHWAECLDMSQQQEENWKWEPFFSGRFNVCAYDFAFGHAVLDRTGQKFLLYTSLKLVFSHSEHGISDIKISTGIFHALTVMDGTIFGAQQEADGRETVCSVNLEYHRAAPYPVQGLDMIASSILGLIPLRRNVLRVLTSSWDAVCGLKVCCSEYRISVTDHLYDEACDVPFSYAAECLANSSYFLNGALSVEGYITMRIPLNQSPV